METITELSNNCLFINSLNPEDKLVYELIYDEDSEKFYINYNNIFKKVNDVLLENNNINIKSDDCDILLKPIDFNEIVTNNFYILPSILK